MDFALIVVALLALLALAFWIRIRRLRQNTLEVIKKFREHGAVSEKKAKTLTEMGLHSKPKHPFLLRDEQVEALSQLLQKGIICQAKQKSSSEEPKFYFDEQKYPMP